MKKIVIFFFTIFPSKIKHTFAGGDDPTVMDFEPQKNEFDNYFNKISNDKFGDLLTKAGRWFENNKDFTFIENFQPLLANKDENMIATESDNTNIESDNLQNANERIEFDSHNQQSPFANELGPLNYYTSMLQFPNTNEQQEGRETIENIEEEAFKLFLPHGKGISNSNEKNAMMINMLSKYPNNNGHSNILDQGNEDMEYLKVLGVNYLNDNVDYNSQRIFDSLKGNLIKNFKIVTDFMKAQIRVKYLKNPIQLLPSSNEIITKYNEVKNMLNGIPKVQLKVLERLKPMSIKFEKEANDYKAAVITETSHLMNLLQNVLEYLETQNDNDIPLGFENYMSIDQKSIMKYSYWIQYFNRNKKHLRLDEMPNDNIM